MKKHLVVLLGGYKPMLSPGSLIMQRILEAMGESYEVSIITDMNWNGQASEEIMDSISVYRVKDYNKLIHYSLQQKIEKSRTWLEKKWYCMLMLLKKIIFYVYRCFSKNGLFVSFENKMYRKLVDIGRKKKIDCIISVAEPHESSAAVYRYKMRDGSNAKWLIYQMDRFANANSIYTNKLDRWIKEPRLYKTELDYLQACDRLIILNPIMQHYSQTCFAAYADKITATDHALLVKPAVEVVGSDDTCVRLIYGGSLDKSLRNPAIALQVVMEAAKSESLKFDLYTFGNCDSLLETAMRESDGVIMNHQAVPRDELVRIIARSDVLVSIGNKSDNEVPSKFFDYLSYGLPIVHFYFSDHDVILEYLKKYPLSLCVKIQENSIEEKGALLADFCREAKGIIYSFTDIENNFEQCTPSYVAKVIGDML